MGKCSTLALFLTFASVPHTVFRWFRCPLLYHCHFGPVSCSRTLQYTSCYCFTLKTYTRQSLKNYLWVLEAAVNHINTAHSEHRISDHTHTHTQTTLFQCINSNFHYQPLVLFGPSHSCHICWYSHQWHTFPSCTMFLTVTMKRHHPAGVIL